MSKWIPSKLVAIVALTSAIGLVGCGKPLDLSIYRFDGNIGKERVKFYKVGNPHFYNILLVDKPDGRTIKFYDDLQLFGNEKLKLKFISVTKDGNELVLKPNNEMRRQYETYLQEIKEKNLEFRAKGVDNLK